MHRVVSASSTTRTVRRGRAFRMLCHALTEGATSIPQPTGSLTPLFAALSVVPAPARGPSVCRAGTRSCTVVSRYSTVRHEKICRRRPSDERGGCHIRWLAFAQGSAQQARPRRFFGPARRWLNSRLSRPIERGQPVTDLKENEIAICRTASRSRSRSSGSRVRRSVPTPLSRSAKRLRPGLFTNRSEYSPGPARNVTAIVIDTLNTLPEDQVAVKAQVMQYLRALAPNTRVAVYMLWDRTCGSSTTSPTISTRCARGSRSTTSSSTFRRSPPTSWTAGSCMEAEHFNEDVDEYVDDEADRRPEPTPSAQAAARESARQHGQSGRIFPGTASHAPHEPDGRVARGAGQSSGRYSRDGRTWSGSAAALQC